MKTKRNDNIIQYVWKKVECELCKSIYRSTTTAIYKQTLRWGVGNTSSYLYRNHLYHIWCSR